MAERRAPSVRSRQLAAELRRQRDEAGLTGEEVAARLGWSAAKVSRVETARTAVSPSDLQLLLDLYEVSGRHRERLEELGRTARQRGWWDVYADMLGPEYATLIALESDADSAGWYAAQIVPGLLQTPEFVRARVDTEVTLKPGSPNADGVLAGRAGRQRMLRRPGGPTYEVIIDEVAISRLAAPPEVVKKQLYYLATTVNGEPKVAVRVLPVHARIADYAVPRCTFSTYTYPDPGDPAVVAVDTVTSDLILTEAADVGSYQQLYQRLRDAALPRDESLDLLTKAAADLHDD